MKPDRFKEENEDELRSRDVQNFKEEYAAVLVDQSASVRDVSGIVKARCYGWFSGHSASE